MLTMRLSSSHRAARNRRIDNHFAAARRRRPACRAYPELDDDLLRIFGADEFARLMNKNLEDGEAIVSPGSPRP